ncbi:pre-B-cell leukemia transcription factor-interacting protein 1 isoform X8 [Rana temporaria]|uniref:pre-B-cell leukemia transcription factor-interacting protein 1 isoform X8 n=1 Tax=Rana temporaria TaxID=8407 RepID=UPI001AAC8F17|nr:pre-B-cell leukemia transcription factor-interacting protein 1 isoform X8 [Rana temporaria]
MVSPMEEGIEAGSTVSPMEEGIEAGSMVSPMEEGIETGSMVSPMEEGSEPTAQNRLGGGGEGYFTVFLVLDGGKDSIVCQDPGEEMAESGENRDTENNWVIPNTEGLPVETVGYERAEPRPGHEGAKPAGPEPSAVPEREETGVQEVKGPESSLQEPESPPTTEIPPHQEKLEIPPEEEPQQRLGEESGLRRRLARYIEKLARFLPDSPPLGGLRSWGRSSASGTGGDLEEVSCSSSEDDAEGLRKRTARGAPPTSVGPAPREAAQEEAEAGISLTLNKCIIAAVALVALAGLIFTGGLGGDEDLPQSVVPRSARGGDEPPHIIAPHTIADIQEWLHQHADQFTGDPDSLQVMNDLLDKVAKENQEIRHIQAKLQAQKEELEALVHGGDKTTPEFRLTEENVRLKDALLREETGHLSAKEELQTLQEKVETLEADSGENELLTSENAQLKADLEAAKSQIEGFLTQKETLVAESQMLRQELDKQRSLVVSLRQDLEGMTSNTSQAEDEKGIKGQISEMSSRLVMEAQRSETWEKKYVEHAQKRKELVGEEAKPHGRKEWKKGDKWGKGSDSDAPGEQFRKPHFKHGKEHGKRRVEDGQPESQHEEWKGKKYENKREKKHRHWEGEKTGTEDGELHPHESDSWKDKGKENRWKDSPHHPDNEKNWKDKHSGHHHGEAGDGFHPRKGQREFSEGQNHGEDKRREHGDKAHGKNHRHHDHNKFWKKLSNHQYRVPEGCSGMEDCARKDGIDLFNVELKPVERKRFEEILQNYLAKCDLSKHLPELVPLLDGFFEGPYFAHQNIRFKDFVDDVEDFLEDLAKKETGNDDLVDDFERFVYTNFFGEAAIKKRSHKKDGHRKSYKSDRRPNPSKPEETTESDLNQTNPKFSNKIDFKVDADNSHYKPYKGKDRKGYSEKSGSPSRHHDDDDDNNDHGWRKHKFEKDAKSHQEDHHETSGCSFNQSVDFLHEQREWPKSNEKDPNHGYRSFHEKHHDRNKDGGHLNEEYKDRQGHLPKNKLKTEDHKDPHGKDRHGHNNSSFMDHGEDLERPFHHQPKQYRKKQEKDAINEYYRSSQPQYEKHEGHHHEHKPRKEGEGHHHEHKPRKEGEDHHHEHKPRKEGEGHHHENKPWKKDHSDHHEHKPRKEGDGDNHHKHKSWKEGDDDNHHKHKSLKEGDGDHHKHKSWKEGNGDHHKHKSWKEGDGDHHKHKSWKEGDGDHHKHKSWKEGDADHHKHKSLKEGDDDDHHKHKSLKEGDGDHHKHKSWKEGDADHHKHKSLKEGDKNDHHKHKSWKEGDGDNHHKHKSLKEGDGDHYKHKSWKEGDGGNHHKHKSLKEGDDDDHHKHKSWKQGDGDHYKYKSLKEGDGDHHKHKSLKEGDGDHHKHKSWKEGDGDHRKHKSWKEGDGDHRKHKSWKEREGDNHKHKSWKESDGDHHKRKSGKDGEGHHLEHKQWKEQGHKHDDHRQKPYKDKLEENKHQSHHNKYDDNEHKSRSNHKDHGKNRNE